MNYAAMAAAIRKERIGERIEHLKALIHIGEAAKRSGNYVRSKWAANVWLAVYTSIDMIRWRENPSTMLFRYRGGYQCRHVCLPVTKHITSNIEWND